MNVWVQVHLTDENKKNSESEKQAAEAVGSHRLSGHGDGDSRPAEITVCTTEEAGVHAGQTSRIVRAHRVSRWN